MNKIYEEVSKETGLPKYMVEKFYKFTIRFLKNSMEEDSMKGLMIPNFGKFVVKNGRRKYLTERENGKTLQVQNNKSDV